MGKGRKPKPTALKLLTGNPGKRKLNQREPQPTRARPDFPAWLDALPEPNRTQIRTAWDRTADRCEEMGVLTVADGAALEVISITLSLYRAAVREVIRDGQTLRPDDEGRILRRHPAVGTAAQWATLLNTMLGKFGLTPADRTRLVVGDAVNADPFELFLKAGHRRERVKP